MRGYSANTGGYKARAYLSTLQAHVLRLSYRSGASGLSRVTHFLLRASQLHLPERPALPDLSILWEVRLLNFRFGEQS